MWMPCLSASAGFSIVVAYWSLQGGQHDCDCCMQGKSDVSVRAHDLNLLHIAAMLDKPASVRLLLNQSLLDIEGRHACPAY